MTNEALIKKSLRIFDGGEDYPGGFNKRAADALNIIPLLVAALRKAEGKNARD